MLKLVRDRGVSPEKEARSAWSQAIKDYEPSDRMTESRQDQFRGEATYRSRRSVAARVFLTVTIAAVFGFAGATAYVATRSGAREPLAQDSTPDPAAQAAAPPARAAQTAPSSQVARPPVPDVPGLVILIRGAVVSLHQANVAGNYSVLREIAAPGFQTANSPAGLSQTFAGLRTRNLDLSQITVVNPRLVNAPVVDERGLLHLVGGFQAGADQVNFELAFQMVNGRWRLFGIGVYPPKATGPAPAETTTVKPPPLPVPGAQGKVPEPATLVALIRGAAIALNQANMTGDYSVLRDISAPGFQTANSLTKLAEVFANLRTRQLDIAPVAVIDPKLFRPAAIDKQGYLRLTGYFPSKPEQVNFDLAFQFGAGQWRLFGIGLNSSHELVTAPEGATQNAGQASVVDPIGGAVSPPSESPVPPDPRPRPSL